MTAAGASRRRRRRIGRAAAVVVLAATAATTGCGERPPQAETAAEPAGGPAGVTFTDITESAGVRFTHFNDASERRRLPETMGSGVALFDYDGDGLTDLYLVNGAPLTSAAAAGGGPRAPTPTGALYRNLGGGRFADATHGSGLDVDFYGMGAAVGDIDNDGRLDLFVTGLGEDRLFRNRGDGRFDDATARLGLATAGAEAAGFGSSAAFLDYDRDGWLDLFAGRYLTWSPGTDVACRPDGVHRSYCTPEVYPGQSNRLYRNLGGTRFEDVTASTGLLRPDGKTLGVAVVDVDRDGWPDLAVANDTVRNFLFVNRGDGRFDERGEAAGVAYGVSGATRGGMGIAAGDLAGSGFPDLVIGNFSQEMAAFYRASSPGTYRDEAAEAGLGLPTLMSLAFGTLVFDQDGDGALDIVFANGHIEPEIAATRRLQTYAQRPQLFHNRGGGTFGEVRGAPGSALETPVVGRGLAAADLDGDGDLDLVLTQNGRPARLLRNDAPPHSWLRLRLEGRASNRWGLGAVVTAVAGDRRWRRELTSGGSYLSASEPVLTFGFGDLDRLDRLEIEWPSGVRQTVPTPPLGELLVVEEPAAATTARPPGSRGADP